MKNKALHTAIIGFLTLTSIPAQAAGPLITGSYMATANMSTIGGRLTSFNNLIGLNFKPSWSTGNFDYRAESYTETSFHSSNGSIINEHKFETQFNYNHPITNIFGYTVGVLYHTDYTIPETYYWGMAGITYSQSISDSATLSATVLAEKRSSGGRIFYDASASAEYHFYPAYSVFVALHRYENYGEHDIEPSQKLEYEIGVNHKLSQQFFTGISYLHHKQYNDPADRFALLKLKFGIKF